jgi:hypothetical protein
MATFDYYSHSNYLIAIIYKKASARMPFLLLAYGPALEDSQQWRGRLESDISRQLCHNRLAPQHSKKQTSHCRPAMVGIVECALSRAGHGNQNDQNTAH